MPEELDGPGIALGSASTSFFSIAVAGRQTLIKFPGLAKIWTTLCMKLGGRLPQPLGRSIRFCIAVMAYARVLPCEMLMTSMSSRRPSRLRNSVANCSSLMYFWSVKREKRRVRSSRRLSLSTISAASMMGALTSLQNDQYEKATVVCLTYLRLDLSRIFLRRFSSVTSSSASSRSAKSSGFSGILRFIHSCLITSCTA